jgi:hypothetical protein
MLIFFLISFKKTEHLAPRVLLDSLKQNVISTLSVFFLFVKTMRVYQKTSVTIYALSFLFMNVYQKTVTC